MQNAAMISISLHDLTLILGARRTFSDLSWQIQHDQASAMEKKNMLDRSDQHIVGLLNALLRVLGPHLVKLV